MRFRCYTTDDIVGVEFGGALKNVLAIACGISDGLGFGYNARAALMTRGSTLLNHCGRLYSILLKLPISSLQDWTSCQDWQVCDSSTMFSSCGRLSYGQFYFSVVKCGANPLTLAGLSGVGDLILTCTGDLSRFVVLRSHITIT